MSPHVTENVGVRELWRDLSGYLRRVEQGESFAVTSRGRAVAVLGPSAEQQDPLSRLILEHGAIPARVDLLSIEPLELPDGPPLSELRDDARRPAVVAELIYLDASAIVKLVVEEAEQRRARSAPRGPSPRIQCLRARGGPPCRRTRSRDARDGLGPRRARPAGAGPIHLATARSLGDDLESLIAYDQRLLSAG